MEITYIQEVQSFEWVGIIPGLVALAFGVIWFFQAVLKKPVGSKPAPTWLLALLFFGLTALAVTLGMQKLTTKITSKAVYMDFSLLASKKVIPLNDLKSIAVRKYDGMGEFSGWGVKGNANERCYTVSGDEGVEIEQKSTGKKVLIGTKRPDEMRVVINRYFTAH